MCIKNAWFDYTYNPSHFLPKYIQIKFHEFYLLFRGRSKPYIYKILREVNKAGITNILGEEGSQNIHGESVKKLDLFADDQLISALDRSNITCMVISEENDGIVRLSADAGK